MHIFSINCKADSVVEYLSNEKIRQEAIKIFRELPVTKVYLESYRTRIFVEEKLLRAIKKDFESEGFEVCGCIVPTRMSERTAVGWEAVTCFSDESAARLMREVVERTAAVFDKIIFDDFLFTSCACEYCQAARGEKTWAEYRTERMLGIVQDSIVRPARAVNKNVKLIIKYPCWYDGYLSGGYDVLRETALFDYSWAGTETRDPESLAGGQKPQMQAFWLQNWMQVLGKCGGGWYDPLDCSPETFVEQARNTILGGAAESLLHCYDYLFLGNVSQAKDGGALNIIKNNLAEQAFRNESTGLAKLAATIENLEGYGVAVPKNPRFDQSEEANLHGFFGMLGIPIQATASLDTLRESCLSAHAVSFDNVSEYLEKLCASGTPFLLTHHALAQMLASGAKVNDAILKAGESLEEKKACFVPINKQAHLLFYEKAWDLMLLDRLDDLRNGLLKNFGLEFYAPSRVSLQLYKNGKRHVEVIQNFNNTPVEVRLKIKRAVAQNRVKQMALPDNGSALLSKTRPGEYRISIAPRSLVVLA